MTIELEQTKLSDWVSIAVASLAFGVTWWQAKTTREHNRVSVTPMLVSSNHWDLSQGALTYSFIVANVGAGVAIVKRRYFTYAGEEFKPDSADATIEELCARTFQEILQYHVATTGLFGSSAKIPPGASLVIAKVAFANPHPKLREVVQSLAAKIDFHLQYESLYGDTFHFSTGD